MPRAAARAEVLGCWGGGQPPAPSTSWAALRSAGLAPAAACGAAWAQPQHPPVSPAGARRVPPHGGVRGLCWEQLGTDGEGRDTVQLRARSGGWMGKGLGSTPGKPSIGAMGGGNRRHPDQGGSGAPGCRKGQAGALPQLWLLHSGCSAAQHNRCALCAPRWPNPHHHPRVGCLHPTGDSAQAVRMAPPCRPHRRGRRGALLHQPHSLPWRCCLGSAGRVWIGPGCPGREQRSCLSSPAGLVVYLQPELFTSATGPDHTQAPSPPAPPPWPWLPRCRRGCAGDEGGEGRDRLCARAMQGLSHGPSLLHTHLPPALGPGALPCAGSIPRRC